MKFNSSFNHTFAYCLLTILSTLTIAQQSSPQTLDQGPSNALGTWHANDNFSLIEGFKDVTVSMHKRGYEAFTLEIPEDAATQDGAFLSFSLKSSSDIELRMDYHDADLSDHEEASQKIIIPGDGKYHNIQFIFPKTYNVISPNQDTTEITETKTSHILFYVNPGKVYAGDLNMKELFIGTIEEQNELLADQKMLVFPNPSHTRFNIQLPTGDFHTVKLIDMSGREVMRSSIHAESLQNELAYIDVTQTQKGIYILQLEGNQKPVSKMVMVN